MHQADDQDSQREDGGNRDHILEPGAAGFGGLLGYAIAEPIESDYRSGHGWVSAGVGGR